MKFNVIRVGYGKGANSGIIYQSWDIDDIKEPYATIFKSMVDQQYSTLTVENLVFLIK